jgi:hypothetical protein
VKLAGKEYEFGMQGCKGLLLCRKVSISELGFFSNLKGNTTALLEQVK